MWYNNINVAKAVFRKGGPPQKMNVSNDVWAKVLQLMEKDMTSTTIKTWFDDAQGVSLEEDEFVLYTPTPWKRDIIQSRYISAIQNALRELFSSEFTVVVLTENELDRYHSPKKQDFMPGTEEYTFDRFVVGSSNKFAHAAALAVANEPGHSYNPLFIHGQSGLGKTHLLYAIAHKVHETYPDYNIIYIKGETFTNEMIQSIRQNSTQEFREKYRKVDLLLVDDVQFIAGRDSTQEEFFHTFNALYENKKQIVLTSDRPPKEISRLENRLQTRFEWGLMADIQPPDYETRVAIIKNKSIRMGLNLPDAVLQYIAENITANVRQIEGTVNKILAFKDLTGTDVDVDSVIRAVRDIFQDKSDIFPTADVIIEEVCKFYNLTPEALRGSSRDKDTVFARQMAMQLIRSMTNPPMSLNEIGRQFGGRDHTTVLHSIEKIEKLRKTDRATSEVVKDITATINAHYG